jgi:hypothetical protein
LSQTRIGALQALQGLELYNRTPTRRIAELFAYVGAIEVFFAEDMCSGVPLGNVNGGSPSYGRTLHRNELLQRALADLDSAASYARTDSVTSNLTRILRGRALLDSGDVAAAAGVVTGVPANYVYQVLYDSLSISNEIAQAIRFDNTVSVSDREGENGLNFLSAGDRRILRDSVSTSGTGQPIFGVQQYQSLTSPITLASGMEAVLIGAEASLAAGNVGDWANALNGLRASAGIAPLPADSTTTATESSRVNTLFRERAFWLFATGHRQGDLRRLVRFYGRATASVFPTGPYQGGPATYGQDVTYVPFGEQYNSNYGGCFDRNP